MHLFVQSLSVQPKKDINNCIIRGCGNLHFNGLKCLINEQCQSSNVIHGHVNVILIDIKVFLYIKAIPGVTFKGENSNGFYHEGENIDLECNINLHP